MLETIERVGEKVTDTRRAGFDLQFKLTDVIKSALVVFFFQYPSLLDFQRKMKEQRKRCNLETILHVQEISGNVQITTLLDSINPDSLNGVLCSTRIYKKWTNGEVSKSSAALTGGIALDRVWFTHAGYSC